MTPANKKELIIAFATLDSVLNEVQMKLGDANKVTKVLDHVKTLCDRLPVEASSLSAMHKPELLPVGPPANANGKMLEQKLPPKPTEPTA